MDLTTFKYSIQPLTTRKSPPGNSHEKWFPEIAATMPSKAAECSLKAFFLNFTYYRLQVFLNL